MRRFVIVLLVGCSVGALGTGCGKSADAVQAEQPRAAGQTGAIRRYEDTNSLADLTSPENFGQGIWYIPRPPAMTTYLFTFAQTRFLQEHPGVQPVTVIPNYRDGQLIGVWLYTEAKPGRGDHSNRISLHKFSPEKFTDAELRQLVAGWHEDDVLAGVTSVTGDDGKTKEVVVVLQKR